MWTDNAGRRWIGDLIEAPPDLVPLVLSRRCIRCSLPTWFARPRQTKHGIHPLCDQRAYTDVLSHKAEREVLVLLVKTFPGATLTTQPIEEPR